MFREAGSRALGAFLVLLAVGTLLGLGYSLFIAGSEFRLGYLGAVVVALILLAMGWKRLFPAHYAPIAIDHDDPLMKEAIATARRELDRFLEGVKEGKREPFIKFPLKSPGGEVEHICGLVHSLGDGVVQTSLANAPVHASGDRDPRFVIALEDIEDWILVDGHGVTEGGYTHLAMALMYKREKGYVPRAMRKQLATFKDVRLDGL